MDAFLGFTFQEQRKGESQARKWNQREALVLGRSFTHLWLLTSASEHAGCCPLDAFCACLVEDGWMFSGSLVSKVGWVGGEADKKEVEPEGGQRAWKKFGGACSF